MGIAEEKNTIMAKIFTDEELNRIDQEFQDLIMEQDRAYLVLDRSIMVRKSVINVLKKLGCEKVVEAKNGTEALARTRAITENELVVITELELPGNEGLQFLVNFRKEQRFAKSPVLLLCQDPRKEKIILAVKAGATAFLKKPVQAETLQAKLIAMKAL